MDSSTAQFWVALVVTAVLGGGAGSSILYLALRERLRDTFATREAAIKQREETTRDLNGLGEKAEAIKSIAMGTREMADSLRDRLNVLEESHRNHQLRFVEVVAEPMRRLVDRMDEQGQALGQVMTTLAEHSAHLRNMGRQLDEMRREG